MAFDAKYTFSPNGMTEDELHFHVSLEKPVHKNSYIETERYGLGKYLKKFGFYPTCMPILLYAPHGPSQWDFLPDYIVSVKASEVGLYSSRLLENWISRTKRSAYLLKSPYAFYVEHKRVKKSKNAKGSLFFHAHSTFWTDLATDYKKVFEIFDTLPECFKPISICMHYVDIQKKLHLPYVKKGYAVYTAGNWNHPFFVENFYEIIRHFNYAFSNIIGSNLLYCVHFNMPFSLIDAEPEVVKEIDPNVKILHHEHKQAQKLKTLFSGIHTSINKEQQQIVQEELALEKSVSRFKMAKILYSSMIKYYSNILFSAKK